MSKTTSKLLCFSREVFSEVNKNICLTNVKIKEEDKYNILKRKLEVARDSWQYNL